jgi:type I restriction enzyme S subunit
MRSVKLSEHLEISRETWSPATSKAEFVYHYSIPNFDSGIAVFEETSSIKSQKFLISEPCVLISKLNPSTPRIWLIEKPLPGINVCSTEFVVLRSKDPLELRYLYALLKTEYVRKKLSEQATGTSNSHQRVKPETVLQIEMDWPESINLRRQIGDFIFSLERKIQLNAEICMNLDEIILGIFKSWFVDFEPVIARSTSSSFSTIEPEMFDEFPNSFTSSKFGEIPKGWELKSIDSLTSTVVGGTPSRANDSYWGGEIPWVNSGKINEFRVTDPSECITSLGLEKSAAKLMPAGTTLIAMTGATLGQYSRLEISAAGTQNVIGILESEMLPNNFIYPCIAIGMPRLVASGTGGAQQHINKSVADKFEFVYPGSQLVSYFSGFVNPFFEMISVLSFESNSLREMQVSLLERITSGELALNEGMLAS